VEDVIGATDYVVPAIELIDSRIVDWKIGIVDTIADNASAAGFALGASRTKLSAIDDIRLLGALLWHDGELVETGAAGAVLGNPLRSVAWLADKVAGFGVTLEAGHVILPGSCTRAVDVRAGDTVVAEFAQLGTVSLSFS
jgi:2-keto-4-pentenoate hydratase